MSKCSCGSGCCSGPKVIYACSGVSDTGEIADRAARKLNKEGLGDMYCLAAIGAKIEGFIKSTKSASEILIIDGCTLACARKTLELAGFLDVEHLVVTETGMEKGKSPVTDERIEKIVLMAKDKLITNSQKINA